MNRFLWRARCTTNLLKNQNGEKFMKALIEKLNLKKQVQVEINARKSERHQQESRQSNFVTLINKNHLRFKGLVLDVSSEGCRLLISGAVVSANTGFVLDVGPELMPLRGPGRFNTTVVWSQSHKIDGIDYCVVGLKFHEEDAICFRGVFPTCETLLPKGQATVMNQLN